MMMADDRSLCLMAGTCITFGMQYLLGLSEAFSRRYRLKSYRTHRHFQFMADFAIDDAELHEAAVFIHHTPGWADWGNDQGYHALLARVPDHVQRISVPYPVFHPLWPFHVHDPRNDDPDRPRTPDGLPAHYPYGDGMVLRLLKQRLGKDEAMRRYRAMNVADEIDLDALLAKSIDMQASKEAKTDVKILDFAVEMFRHRRVFLTMNHVGNASLIHMVDQILHRLGCPPLGRFAHESLFELIDPQMPIHPSVIRHFDLTCVTPETRYRVDNWRNLTFDEYLSCYIDFV
ncbi:hypothetical protein JZU57_00855 [bacterium]|nr:hypothetical protein [bacterium]